MPPPNPPPFTEPHPSPLTDSPQPPPPPLTVSPPHPHPHPLTDVHHSHSYDSDHGKSQSPEPEILVPPPRPGKKEANGDPPYDIPGNSRRLNAINVTIRRPSESEPSYSALRMSKEALLLRSGVTLRQGMNLSMSSFSIEKERERRETGGSAFSGSDEEDSLEPVNK